MLSFNPQPPRRTAATYALINVFQSSAAPKDGSTIDIGLTGVSILSRPEGRLLPAQSTGCPHHLPCFNPQPPRRTAATVINPPAHLEEVLWGKMFQSSAAPKDGCYAHEQA